MLFNSIEYLIFLPIVFLLYWMISRWVKWQNLFVVVVSYIFYGWWDWRFLGLIFGASMIAWGAGLLIERYRNNKTVCRWVCGVNIGVCFGILGVFKYYNFFATSFAALFAQMGIDLGSVTLQLVLPVGISFYTFQGVGYTIDVYRGKVASCRNVVTFLAFLSFFPQLVAGPIERASNLLPQFESRRRFDYNAAVDGMRQMLWGFFKKMVVADNCTSTVDWLFSNYQGAGGVSLLFGAFLFSVQMYCDFSGYSDIALGTGRLFGIRLMQNFKFPYFSRDIAEFWSRWHISLTRWFRDYVYIPLGGNRHGLGSTIRNTIIVFLVSGLWHGAEWSYIVWGAYNAMLFVPLLIAGKSHRYKGTTAGAGRVFPSLREFLLMGVTFLLVVLGWVFFRAENMTAAADIFKKIFTDFTVTPFPLQWMCLAYIAFMFVVEWVHRNCAFGLQLKETGLLRYRVGRWCLYIGLSLTILLLSGHEKSFIYFQF